MADRQYGILPGASISGTPPPASQGKQRTQSPPKRSYPQNYAPTFQQADQPPPPPVHKTISRKAMPSSHVMPTSSDVSDYQPPNSSLNALRGLDNLYNPPLRTPSPDRYAQSRTPPRQGRSMVPVPQPAHSPSPVSHQQALLGHPGSSRQAYSQSPSSIGHRHAASIPSHSPSPTRTDPRSPFADQPGSRLSAPSMLARNSYYQGDGYDDINPAAIIDDGDDDEPIPRNKSRLAFIPAAGMRPFGSRDTSGQYGPVPVPNARQAHEKSAWLDDQQQASRRRKRILWVIGILVLLGIIAGAVAGGVIAAKKGSGGGGSSAASTASRHSGGDYDINSAEIQAVLNNKDLHRVFPVMDYTPLNAQYPACVTNPPDQNNVTIDIALLSQLTPSVRLYGMDCGQTELVLSAIDKLKMNDSMTVWLGVWLEKNTTTNARQMQQMYDLLDKYPAKHFAGVIVGNEVLFRQDMTLTQLGTILSNVRANLTAKGINLPVATADLGDNWTAGLAATTDIVMANVHPFFAGVTPDVAPGWTYNFWQSKDSSLATVKAASWPKSVISEVGWPSEGGNDCGTTTGACPSGQGAVASIDNMNKFMDGFVCQSLNNGTTFFWFEAFDEPWKVVFNTDTDKWESKWGLMDSDRNLKPGLKIPDCGGKSLTKPY